MNITVKRLGASTLIAFILSAMLVLLSGCDENKLKIDVSDVKTAAQTVLVSSDYKLVSSAIDNARYTTIYYNDTCYVRIFIKDTGAAPVFKFKYHSGWSLV